MSEISLSPALSRAFEDRVDLGSWAGFTSSLARFLDEVCRPLARRGEAVEAVIDPSGGTLLLTAPVPMVKAEELVDYTPEEKVFERLTRRLGAAIGQGAVSALRSVALR